MSTLEDTQEKADAEILKALKLMRDRWLVTLDIYDFQAQNYRAKYNALLRHGFTEQQAMYLCTQHWSL